LLFYFLVFIGFKLQVTSCKLFITAKQLAALGMWPFILLLIILFILAKNLTPQATSYSSALISL
jgi:predicted tellurium resistance membrane protein TerC